MDAAATASGYWEPHTSSVDFCESNYLYSSYVVEIHNVWSSLLGITSWGVLGLWQTTKRTTATPSEDCSYHPLQEIRTRIAFLLLVGIGLGSMGLHGTLHWIFQSSDELPMLYLVLVGAFSVVHVADAPHQQPTTTAAWFTFGLAVLHTVLYYAFQDVYEVFLVTFVVGTYINLYKALQLLRTDSCTPATRAVAWRGIVVFFVVAGPIWVLDMLLWCNDGQYSATTSGGQRVSLVDSLSNKWLGGMTPHVLWHFCAGFGGYCLMLFMVASRCDILRMPITIEYYCGGVVPVIHPTLDAKKKA